MVGAGRGQGGAGGGGGYYYSTLQAVSLSASLSPHLFLPSSSWLLLACSPHSTPAHLAFAAAVAPAPSNPPCARATGREQGSCARTAYAAFFRLDQTVPVSERHSMELMVKEITNSPHRQSRSTRAIATMVVPDDASVVALEHYQYVSRGGLDTRLLLPERRRQGSVRSRKKAAPPADSAPRGEGSRIGLG